jgi:1,4-dihydroxy-2-naphthoate octaprenyltransferase
MYDRHASQRTDYERARPAPRALTALAVAVALVVTLTAALATPVLTAAALVATPLALRVARTVRARRPLTEARAAALRVESLLSAALQR